MKNILLSLAAFTILAACDSKADLNTQPEEITIQNLPLYSSAYADTAKTVEADYKPAKIVKSRSKAAIKRNVNVVATRDNTEPVYTSETTSQPRVVTTPVATPTATTDNTVPSAEAGSNENTTVTTTPQPEKKRGWSKAAKGTVIGAGAGAIGGAILSKKKGLGAIVGGVVGAAGGYIIGKKMDKKDNRFIEN